MQFTTKVPISKNAHPIGYESTILTLGSCFAVNIADKFNYYKFQNSANPFGILFHPLAIHEVIRRAVHAVFYEESDLFFHNERWHCFDAHSDLSAINKEDLLRNLNQKLIDLKTQIENASHMFITYGTAWVYRFKASQKFVANCHKVPQAQFTKELLTAEKIQDAIDDTIALIQKVNPTTNIVFTVSPVRHLKDGFIENQCSKANLIIGIHNTIDNTSTTENRQSTTLNYFPSYEIMMDELRDYRFYAEDLLHPNTIAINYIWERFAEASVSSEALAVMKEIESIQKALSHRPFNPDSDSHSKFRAELLQTIARIEQRFPQIKF